MRTPYPSAIQAFLERPPRLLIDGGWTQVNQGTPFETFVSIDPGNKAPLATLLQADAAVVDHAVEVARKVFKDTVSGMNGGAIGGLLHRLASLIERDLEVLATIESLDNGKPIGNARMDMQSASTSFTLLCRLGR